MASNDVTGYSVYIMKSSNIKTYVGITLLIVCAVLYGLFSNKNTSALRVGIVLPMTGKFADISEDVLRAVDLAQEDFKGLHIDIEDSAGEPSKAVTAVTNLIHVKKSEMILSGPGGSTSNTAMAPIVSAAQIPFMAISSAAALREKEDNLFIVYPFVGAEMEAMSAHLIRQGKKKVAVVYDIGSDTQSTGVDVFRRTFELSQGEIISSEGYGKDVDYRTLVSKLIQMKPDAVFVLGSDKVTGQFVKHIREQSYTGLITGFSSAESDVFLTTAGAYSSGFEVSTVPFFCDRNQYAQKYCGLYKTRYNKNPTAFSAYTYDLLHLIAVAHDACQNGADIRSCLAHADISGSSLTESFKLDKYGDLSKDALIHIKKVVDGKFVLLK